MWQRELTAQFPTGTLLGGKYRVERMVGSGGMGVVLAVRHEQLDELYALKLMHPVAATNAAARERFAREAKAAAKLRSEHVARAIDFGFMDEDGPPYMVLELLEGRNLADTLAEKGPLDPTQVSKWILQACDALREAHEHGIVHRDLKPSNVFLADRASGTSAIKVLDFGIAKTVAADSGALTKTATTMGSPFYMSPEQMRSAKTADERSDIWSLGITMYELTTGRVPFTGESVTEVAISVIECAVESPLVHRPDLPPEFVEIVMRCLEKRPERRYQCVDELAESLAEFSGVAWTSRPRAPKTIVAPSVAPGTKTPSAFASTEAEGSDASATVPAEPAMTLIKQSSSHDESADPRPTTGDGIVRPLSRPAPLSRIPSGGRAFFFGVAAAGALGVGAWLIFGASNPVPPPEAAAQGAEASASTRAATGEEGSLGNPAANKSPSKADVAARGNMWGDEIQDQKSPPALSIANEEASPPPTTARPSVPTGYGGYAEKSPPTKKPPAPPAPPKAPLPSLGNNNEAVQATPKNAINQEAPQQYGDPGATAKQKKK